MTEPMTEERLAELREYRDNVRRWDGAVSNGTDWLPAIQADRDFADAVDELDRVLAENTALSAGLDRALEFLDRARAQLEACGVTS